jgi:asparagine synthase (glutamine-hydrolysing)
MEVLTRMTEAIRHRGPDDEGYYRDGPLGLGFRRLSIIDIQGGRQPMFNEDKSLCIIYNGEIYNYRRLRRDLESAGHCFQTSSDTEVIVHGYEEYGRDVVTRLNGMFAFALWDQNARRLFMARDRTGIKPLYYAETAQGLIFGSELKTILVHPAVARQIDPAALNQYLALEYVPTPRTIYRVIKKLPPGHMLTL